jgi:hypothetical protein
MYELFADKTEGGVARGEAREVFEMGLRLQHFQLIPGLSVAQL